MTSMIATTVGRRTKVGGAWSGGFVSGVVFLSAVFSLVMVMEGRALAAWAQSTDCHTNPVDEFCPDQTVCIMGDIQYTCPRGPIDLPGVDVYIIPSGSTDPFSGAMIHIDPSGSFGDFWGIEVMTPPLPPGTYDIVLDEHCNGIWEDGIDGWEHEAFTVGVGCSCSDVENAGDRRIVDDHGGLCHGACGAGCSNCEEDIDSVCHDVASCCMHCTCTYQVFYCPTHQQCQWHDKCYEDCDDDPYPYVNSFTCRRAYCDYKVAYKNSLHDWVGWLGGWGPMEGWLVYSGAPSLSGPDEGLCSGPCE